MSGRLCEHFAHSEDNGPRRGFLKAFLSVTFDFCTLSLEALMSTFSKVKGIISLALNRDRFEHVPLLALIGVVSGALPCS